MREDVVSSTIQLISDAAAVQPDAVYCLWEATKNLKNLEDFQPLVQVDKGAFFDNPQGSPG